MTFQMPTTQEIDEVCQSRERYAGSSCIHDHQCDYCDDQASHMEIDEVPHYFCDYCHYTIVVEMSSITNFPMYSAYCWPEMNENPHF